MEHPFIDKIRQIVLDHLDDEKFGVSELASELGLSKSQTFRKVKSNTGRSVNQLIRETRLREAAALILNTDLHASEISYKVGFSSPSYFNKCFRKYYGVTPGEYKEKNKEIPPVKGFHQIPSPSRIKKFQSLFYILGAALLIFVIVSIFNIKNTTDKTTPAEISIAVLYFDDHSPEMDKQWFCNAITEEIIAKLVGIKQLVVASRTSVKQYKNSLQSIPEIAKALGVDYIVQGSITMDNNNNIKIIAQLINANNEHIWKEEYNDLFDDVFTIQQNVAKKVAEKLKIDLSVEEIKIIEKYPTDNMEAYNLFLQAEYQRSKRNHNAFTNAMLLYEEVIALDSTFVEAYIGMSDIWQFGGIIWGLYNEQEAWEKSKELLLKAAIIDSDNKQIEYNLHFGYFYFEWDFKAMEEYYQTLLSNSDHYNITGLAQDYAIKTGKYDGALLINERFIVNAALINYIYAYRAVIFMFMGKEKEAIDVLEKYKSLYSDDLFYLRESSKLYFYLKEYERSKSQLNEIRIKFPNDNPPLFVWMDAVYAKMDGKEEDAVLYLDELIILYDTHKSGSPAWFIALYYCYTEDYENAFKWLQKSYDRHEVELTWFREEPLLIPLRNDKRYKDLYDKIGFSKIE